MKTIVSGVISVIKQYIHLKQKRSYYCPTLNSLKSKFHYISLSLLNIWYIVDVGNKVFHIVPRAQFYIHTLHSQFFKVL